MNLESDKTDLIKKALYKVQSEIDVAIKDQKNPFHKTFYAGLPAIWDCCKDLLIKNGILTSQIVDTDEQYRPTLITKLTHIDSGQWIGSVAPLLCKTPNNPQDLGSAITYMRRYSLQALLCIIAEDDDGSAASGYKNQKEKPEANNAKNEAPKTISAAQHKELADLLSKCTKEFANNVHKALEKEGLGLASLNQNGYLQIKNAATQHIGATRDNPK